MRNDETCALLHEISHGFLNEHFAACVDQTRRFVEDEHSRVCQKGTGNGQDLSLTLGKPAGIIVQ